MELRKFITTTIREYLNENFNIVDKTDFKDVLLDLATLDLEDNQVRYPKMR